MSSILESDFRYWAFISYSSSDVAFARWLHRAIESYGIPAEFCEHDTGPEKRRARRLRPVFRDRAELPASATLSAVIEEALRQSRFLIVVCSPRSAKSKWVNREIETFERFHGSSKVLAIIMDGPRGATASECFPPRCAAVSRWLQTPVPVWTAEPTPN